MIDGAAAAPWGWAEAEPLPRRSPKGRHLPRAAPGLARPAAPRRAQGHSPLSSEGHAGPERPPRLPAAAAAATDPLGNESCWDRKTDVPRGHRTAQSNAAQRWFCRRVPAPRVLSSTKPTSRFLPGGNWAASSDMEQHWPTGRSLPQRSSLLPVPPSPGTTRVLLSIQPFACVQH